jgi:major membrane immunogen (membrane-anchored lipoprotein)
MRHQNIVWAMLAAFMLASCSTSHQSNSEQGSMEGTIYSIGNDPFSKLGLESVDGNMYILKCSKELEKELYTKQGKILKVYYESRDGTPEGRTLKIVKFEYSPNSQ